MTWRVDDELLERVRSQAQARGRSLNEWVTEVLAAVSDPDTAGSEGERIRERLRVAGLLEPVPVRKRRAVDEARLAAARAAAGRGTSLSDLVGEGRR